MLIRIYLLLIIFCVSLNAQQQEKVVARVGDYKIYESEFRERFDFSAHPKLLNNSDKSAAKHEFLEQLIAEKLLSLEAREKGYNTSEIFTNMVTPLENMFVRDALYNLEIKSKTNYSQKEINEGIERIYKILKVKFLFSKNHEESEYLYSLLKAGVTFDSLLTLRPEVNANPKDITFGTMEKNVEDSIYNLKQGEFTEPIESEDGFYIMMLIQADPNPALKGLDMVLEDVKKIVETRAEHKKYLEYYHNFFIGHKVTADRVIFENLIKILVPKFKSKYSSTGSEIHNQNPDSDSGKYYLRGSEVASVMQLLDSNIGNKIFIKLGEKEVKLNYFINQLSPEGLFVKDINEISIRASLSSYIRKFIEDELLTSEGNKKGLRNSPDVEKYMKMWEDSYLSKILMTNMFDSVKVTEDEAYFVYQQNEWKDMPVQLVNVAEVLTDSLKVIETVLNELSKGKNIKDLARQYTKRDSLKNKGGDFGYFPVTEHGEIGRIASQMKIGDLYGPIKLDEGYSVFQLIDKIPVEKSATDSITAFKEKSKEEFGQLKDQITMQLSLSKFEKYVNEYNAHLAQKYGVEIYEDVLNGLDDIFMNLVVVRYMGFGGEIFAVPYTEQYFGWYDIWMKNKNMNP